MAYQKGPAKRKSAIVKDYASSENARTAQMTRIESGSMYTEQIHSAGLAATPTQRDVGTQDGMCEIGITSGEKENGIDDPWRMTYQIQAYRTGDTRSRLTLEREKLVLMIYDDVMKTLSHLEEF